MRRFATVAVIVGVLSLIVLLIAVRSQTVVRGKGLPLLRPAGPPAAVALFDAALTGHNEYRRNAALWSFAFFSCVFGAALLSASAGIILKLNALEKHDALRKDLAVIFAASAALLITLSTSGNFEEKWRANRRAASGMESAIYKLITPGAKLEDVIADIREVHQAQDDAVVSHAAETTATH